MIFLLFTLAHASQLLKIDSESVCELKNGSVSLLLRSEHFNKTNIPPPSFCNPQTCARSLNRFFYLCERQGRLFAMDFNTRTLIGMNFNASRALYDEGRLLILNDSGLHIFKIVDSELPLHESLLSVKEDFLYIVILAILLIAFILLHLINKFLKLNSIRSRLLRLV